MAIFMPELISDYQKIAVPLPSFFGSAFGTASFLPGLKALKSGISGFVPRLRGTAKINDQCYSQKERNIASSRKDVTVALPTVAAVYPLALSV